MDERRAALLWLLKSYGPIEDFDPIPEWEEMATAVLAWHDAEVTRARREAVEEAARAERTHCIALLCDRCARGEPILDAAECERLGHPRGPCHEFRGMATVAHIGCRASALRMRTSPMSA